MFCKYLKLVNGENIIVTTDSDCKNFKDYKNIPVTDPVLIKNLHMTQGPFLVETFTMQPWIKVAKSDIIEIPTESIIVAVDLHQSTVDQYKSFIMETSNADPNVEEITDEGYESFLESINEQEEDDAVELTGRRARVGKTIH